MTHVTWLTCVNIIADNIKIDDNGNIVDTGAVTDETSDCTNPLDIKCLVKTAAATKKARK